MKEIALWFLISLFSTIIFAYTYYSYTDVNVKLNFKVKSLIFLGAIIQTTIQYFGLTVLSVISFFIYFPVLFYNINKISFKKLIYYIFIIWFYGVIIDIILTLFISLGFYLFDRDFSIYNNYSVIISMILSLIVSIVIFILSKSNFAKNKTNCLYDKINTVEYTDAIFVILALFIVCVDIIMFLNVSNLDVSLLLIFITVLMFISFIILFKYKLDTREIDEYLKILRENNEFYIRVDDDNRIFKHNLTAKLSSIKSVGNKKTNSLIDDLILQFNKSIDFSSSIKVIPYGLNGIIYQKLYLYLDDLNVKINNEINYDILAVLKPRRYNVFVEKMMLALDNAIESCLKSKEKALVINIFDDEVNIYVEVENTFASDIDLDLLGTKSYSTKGKRRGLGLFSMFRNNEAKVTVKIINNLFVNKITTKKRLND